MGKFYSFMSKVNFWIFNWIFVPSPEQVDRLEDLTRNNLSKSQKWFFISVILNVAPFILAGVLEAYLHSDNLKCFLNNGTLPILSFGIISTNFFYLLENIPGNLTDDKELYENMKLKITVLSIICLFIATTMYILQSNFIGNFGNNHYWPSIIFSIVVLIYSVSCAKKMFLLQNIFLTDYAKTISNLKNDLNKKDDEFKQ
jgi:hypothetical protein